MRAIFFPLAISLSLGSCIPESSGTQTSTPSGGAAANAPSTNLTDERLQNQGERIGRLETELHEMRLLFTNQLKRIEEVANRPSSAPAPSYQGPQQPQQVVILPNSPVVTHRWDETPTAPASSASRSARSYRVQPNDTLSQIAQAHGIPLGALMTANPGLDPLRLRIGKELFIPGSTQAANYLANLQAQARGHTVKAGDTLSEIAQSYGISLRDLMEHNPGLDPSRLQVGKQLTIPSASRPTPGSASTSVGFASPPRHSLPYPSGEASSPASYDSLQELPPEPSYEPQYNSHPAPEPTHRILIRVPKTTTFGAVAAKVGTDVETLNRVNNTSLAENSRILANATIYVPSSAPEQ